MCTTTSTTRPTWTRRTALEGTDWADKPIEEVVANLSQLPDDKRGPVRNNGGGHLNHGLFWESMSPDGGGAPEGDLAAAIDEAFGSFDELKTKMKDAGVGQFARAGRGSCTMAPASPWSPLPTRTTRSPTARRPCSAWTFGARLLPEVPRTAARTTSTRGGTRSTGRRWASASPPAADVGLSGRGVLYELAAVRERPAASGWKRSAAAADPMLGARDERLDRTRREHPRARWVPVERATGGGRGHPRGPGLLGDGQGDRRPVAPAWRGGPGSEHLQDARAARPPAAARRVDVAEGVARCEPIDPSGGITTTWYVRAAARCRRSRTGARTHHRALLQGVSSTRSLPMT